MIDNQLKPNINKCKYNVVINEIQFIQEFPFRINDSGALRDFHNAGINRN